ncbi:MAG: methylenetetrahydromethanopterin dehydrogenase [Pirellulaceae bacterium]|nr:methylenetetrahydromethanopterin dehydrogenase [Pirellulaceae bacterium]
MSKAKILVQLDPDPHASVFDAVVAVDAGVDHLLQYHQVTADQVRDLVHGTMFTRGINDLSSTAIFVGGSNVAAGEALLSAIEKTFFGPMRVSVLMDANGANTTAAAAVVAAGRHLDFSQTQALVLAGTGPVGQRAARLLSAAGARVRLASRDPMRAASACEAIRARVPSAQLEPIGIQADTQLQAALEGTQLVIAAGAAGIQLLDEASRQSCKSLQVAIDLNAVPPVGIEGIEVMDAAVERQGVIGYGAIGVGGTKMKIHKAALRRLFVDNEQILDAEAIYSLGCELEAQS